MFNNCITGRKVLVKRIHEGVDETVEATVLALGNRKGESTLIYEMKDGSIGEESIYQCQFDLPILKEPKWREIVGDPTDLSRCFVEGLDDYFVEGFDDHNAEVLERLAKDREQKSTAPTIDIQYKVYREELYIECFLFLIDDWHSNGIIRFATLEQLDNFVEKLRNDYEQVV